MTRNVARVGDRNFLDTILPVCIRMRTSRSRSVPHPICGSRTRLVDPDSAWSTLAEANIATSEPPHGRSEAAAFAATTSGWFHASRAHPLAAIVFAVFAGFAGFAAVAGFAAAAHAQGFQALYSRDGIDVWAVGDQAVVHRSFDG